MTMLDDRNDDLLRADHDPGMARLVAELDTLGAGSPSPQADLKIRHALAGHARDLDHQRRRPHSVRGGRQRRRIRLLPARLSAAVAALAAILLSVGTYLHVHSPTPVSAQTVLHRAATASPGPNMATHAVYQLTATGGIAGSADVWLGYDGRGVPRELALILTMSQDGHPAPNLSGSLTVVGPDLATGSLAAGREPGQMPVPAAPGQTTPPAKAAPSGHSALQLNPSAPDQAKACDQCGVLKGMVVGTVLAQRLSTQANASTLHQTTLDGVSVYAIQVGFTGAKGAAGGATFYFNTQTYVLEGTDWVQEGTSWQARLVRSSIVPLSAVPARAFGSQTDAGRPGDKPRVAVSSGAAPTRQQP